MATIEKATWERLGFLEETIRECMVRLSQAEYEADALRKRLDNLEYDVKGPGAEQAIPAPTHPPGPAAPPDAARERYRTLGA